MSVIPLLVYPYEQPSLFSRQMSDTPPKNSPTGLGMFSSVGKGEKEAVEFFNHHVDEVKKIIYIINLFQQPSI